MTALGGQPVRVTNEMRLEVLSRPENVALARVALAAFASQLDFTLADLEEIKVAVSEAVSNSVIHAYDGEAGVIRVTGRLGDDTLEIVVEDWGRGIADVAQARQPSWSSVPDRMGLGFAFMESFMDGIEVSSEVGKGTTVRMWKRRRAPAAESGRE